MKRSDQLDKIINILYDKDNLHWKGVPAIDIIAFGSRKFNLNMTDPEVNFALEYLIGEGYIKLESGDNPKYFLTVKGILLKEQGGFKRINWIQTYKDLLYVVSLIAVIIAGVYYIFEIIKFIFCSPFCPVLSTCIETKTELKEEVRNGGSPKVDGINTVRLIDTLQAPSNKK